jgi:CxxC motif-containing protein (DUF1111 family)
MGRHFFRFLCGAFAALASVSGPAAGEPGLPVRLGGEASRAAGGIESFGLPVASLKSAHIERFFAGRRLFNTTFIAAPSSLAGLSGLGPTFNRPSCAGCHVGDGRGRPPASPDDALMQMIVRLSDRGAPHGSYGNQLNERAIEGVPAEGRASIAWREIEGRYADGQTYRLRAPVLSLTDLAFGEIGSTTHKSLRVAPQLVGLGLLERIADQRILAFASQRDADGVQGVPRWIRSLGSGVPVVGRFGWRADQPSLRRQVAAALLEDMGLTTTVHPAKNCPPPQTSCRAADAGTQPNLDDEALDTLVFYIAKLAVPERRNGTDAEVRSGEKIFAAIGCAACHKSSVVLESGETIHPFTDLLLHDLGAGLADLENDGDIPGSLWRTAPLWGIGLVPTVNGHENYLHDGRARGLGEAILWHGGAAQPAKERFRTLPERERNALIAFLRSL